jgi:hypothetical protein
MTRSLQPLGVLLVALVIIGVLAAIAVTPPADDSDPSSRSAGKLGSLALYTWLGGLGLPVSRISGGFALSGEDVLIEYDPSTGFTTAEANTVTEFVRGGGDLILVVDPSSVSVASPLLRRLGVAVGAPQKAGTAAPAQPFVPANDVHAVPTGAGFSLRDQPSLVPLLRQGDAVVAGATAVGSGRAYVLGDSLPLSNDGLRHGDSAYLVLGLLARARGGHIGFDEVHHGETGTVGSPAAIFDGPLGVAACLAVALTLIVLAVNGRRIGRAVAAADVASVPSATAYVSAMGDLFARSRHRGMIAARYAEQLKRAVSARTGVAAGLDDDTFVAALRASGTGGADDVAALLRQARELAAAQPDERALLKLARDVAVVERTWTPTPQ